MGANAAATFRTATSRHRKCRKENGPENYGAIRKNRKVGRVSENESRVPSERCASRGAQRPTRGSVAVAVRDLGAMPSDSRSMRGQQAAEQRAGGREGVMVAVLDIVSPFWSGGDGRLVRLESNLCIPDARDNSICLHSSNLMCAMHHKQCELMPHSLAKRAARIWRPFNDF